MQHRTFTGKYMSRLYMLCTFHFADKSAFRVFVESKDQEGTQNFQNVCSDKNNPRKDAKSIRKHSQWEEQDAVVTQEMMRYAFQADCELRRSSKDVRDFGIDTETQDRQPYIIWSSDFHIGPIGDLKKVH